MSEDLDEKAAAAAAEEMAEREFVVRAPYTREQLMGEVEACEINKSYGEAEARMRGLDAAIKASAPGGHCTRGELIMLLRYGDGDSIYRDEALARLLEAAEKDHALLANETMRWRGLCGQALEVLDGFCLFRDDVDELYSIREELRGALE